MSMKNYETNPEKLHIRPKWITEDGKTSLRVVKMKGSPQTRIYKDIWIYISNVERRSLNKLPSQSSVIPQEALSSLGDVVKTFRGAGATNLSFRPRKRRQMSPFEEQKYSIRKAEQSPHGETLTMGKQCSSWVSHCLLWSWHIFNKWKYHLYISIFVALKNNF